MLVQFTQVTECSDDFNEGNSIEHINSITSLRFYRKECAILFSTNSGNSYVVYCSTDSDSQRVFSDLRSTILSGPDKYGLLRRSCCTILPEHADDSALVADIRKYNARLVDENITPLTHANGMCIQGTCAMTDTSTSI